MSDPQIERVRSAIGTPGVRRLHWRDDDIHPYTVLEDWIVRVTPHGVFTQRLGAKGTPIGHVVSHVNLVSALAMLGWEPC